MFLLNSCLGLLSAARFPGHPFSLSYGVILPNSLAMLLPLASGSSPCLPVSVCGTGPLYAIAAFPGSHPGHFAGFMPAPLHASALLQGFFLLHSSCACTGISSPGCPSCLRPHISGTTGHRNLNLLSIGYASRPLLRPRLTQGRQALPWKPQTYGR